MNQSKTMYTDEQVNHMVDRFLTWEFPATMNPDGAISLKPGYSKPVGTNLLSATEATAMVRHMLKELPSSETLTPNTKTMKILKLPFLCFLLAGLFSALGCTTMQTPTGTVRVVDTNIVDKTAIALKTFVTGGAIIAVEKDHNSALYFRLASAVVDKVILAGDPTPATLSKAVSAVPLKELQSDEARIAIAAALGLYGVYFEDYVKGKINGNYAATALLTALRDGINDALPVMR